MGLQGLAVSVDSSLGLPFTERAGGRLNSANKWHRTLFFFFLLLPQAHSFPLKFFKASWVHCTDAECWQSLCVREVYAKVLWCRVRLKFKQFTQRTEHAVKSV